MKSQRIAIFASGSGSNAENIINYSRVRKTFQVTKIYCNKCDAGIIARGHRLGIPVVVFNKEVLYSTSMIHDDIVRDDVDAIVLAGFLLLIPENLLRSFMGRIVNIHPALLPNYGGKGMYGAKVHEAVIANKEKTSGITIHHVNEVYDEGKIIFQASCDIDANDTPDTLAHKIHELEYKHFPRVVEQFLLELYHSEP